MKSFIDLADMINYKFSSDKRFRYTFVILDNFSKHLLCIPLKNKNSKTVTDAFSRILTTSKISPIELQLGSGSEW